MNPGLLLLPRFLDAQFIMSFQPGNFAKIWRPFASETSRRSALQTVQTRSKWLASRTSVLADMETRTRPSGQKTHVPEEVLFVKVEFSGLLFVSSSFNGKFARRSDPIIAGH